MTIRRLLSGLLIPMFAIAACAGDDGKDGNEAADPGAGGGVALANEGGGGDDAKDDGEPAPDCEPGPPPIDPADLAPCPSYICEIGGAHCVPKGLVPADQTDLLAECNKDMFCVPDPLIETMGKLEPKVCTAVMGLEGRCLSPCIPQVADSAGYLEQDICESTELCVPCFDPLTTESTGACDLTCDPGPSEVAPEPLPTCCPGGDGTCVPGELVPAGQAGSLAQDVCPDSGQLCVPNEMLDPNYAYQPCAPDELFQFLGIDEGNCIPKCVDAVKGIGSGSCPSGYACAPCDALGEATGACPEDW
jgi:hypothetical protein